MTWSWETNERPGPQTTHAGARWTFRLPLRGDPPVEWDIPDWAASARYPDPDPRKLVLDIPSDRHGVHELKYRIGEGTLWQPLWLKILPAQGGRPVQQPDSGGADAARPPGAQASSPGIAAGVADGSRSDEPKAQPFATASPEPAARSTPSSSLATRSEKPPEPPPLTGDYEVQAFRAGTPLPDLTRRLEHHKSLLVGKRSFSSATFPDIDLKGRFADPDAERRCSRQQARVYWSEGRILLHNEGKSPIALPGGTEALAPGKTYAWQPGEEVTLPGGLCLRLMPIME